MKRYNLTEHSYHQRFRAPKPEVDENPEQCIVQLDTYFICYGAQSFRIQNGPLRAQKIFKLMNCSLTIKIVKEQFIDSCPKDLAIHLRERAPETLAQMVNRLQRSLICIQKHMENIFSVQPIGRPQKDETKNQQNESATVVCFKCNACGHKYKHNAMLRG